ncbi:MAG: PIN domain-containing protein [Verrucomicrobia bacterium]|nr:PIN domain-containing protein [Verrucomicrobiota bacterium]
MSYLIDTDLLSFLRRKGRSRKLEKFVEENEDDIFVSVVSWAEIEFGITLAEEKFQEDLRAWAAATRRRFSASTEPLDESVLLRWKQLLSDLKSQNRTLTCEDSLIAATALQHGHTILTHNLAHFAPTAAPVFDPMR